MGQIWTQNEEKDGDEELVVTFDHSPPQPRDEERSDSGVEIPPGTDPQDALDALSEDVSSSPAERGSDTSAPGDTEESEQS
ncbi:hypothetical protein [Leucobacter aridicollis]|uniref:hypothetical protein n=1 Tax=Leucobacter aridicollis TaxID=283878 RepID=UPI000E6521FC|nr:hypothetical protein [Leucobacter aridicollis]UTX53881.1 hypothetical protein KI794_03885 [Leucobacter aridicollis]